MARNDKHRWLYEIGQEVCTPLGDAKIISITPKAIQVYFPNAPEGAPLTEKFYANPTYEHQASIDQISCNQESS